MWSWILGVVVVGLILFALHREIYFYEGTHLGARVQSWLYDSWAKNYDQDKQESQAHDAERLARPILEAMKNVSTPLVLDYASGTGRLPLTLLRQPDFKGHVIALDVSRGMLEQANTKLVNFKGRYELTHLVNLPLPFPDDSFDVVSCLEALELMPDMEEPLAELLRVLKPGGVFISSRGTEASGRKAKIRSATEFKNLLTEMGFEQVQVTSWWRWFDHVWARKPGELIQSGHHSLADVLHCPKCDAVNWEATSAGLRCQGCAAQVRITGEGVFTYGR